MTRIAAWFVHCDACDGHHPADQSAHTARDASDQARQYGWRRTRDGRDICEDCWADGER